MSNAPIIIEVKHLNKSFNGKRVVIDLNLTVREGEICAFLGPNGSGKTTTLRMLCGLLTPDSGEGTCLGYNILTESFQIKSNVGYMTQSFSLYHDLTGYENLDFIARIYNIPKRREKIAAALKQFNLTEFKNQLAGSLSGGMKQRLALAGCMLHQPKLLLLDEPTAGVDPKARREFWEAIHKLSLQGITTLVSTHYMDEAERCTSLAYISYGYLLAEGRGPQIINESKLHTWRVSGPRLAELARNIHGLPGVEETAFFGTTLHVSGKNEALLTEIAKQWEKDGYHWEKIPPSLEDIFISLVGKTKDQL